MSWLFDDFHPNKKDVKRLNREGFEMILTAMVNPEGFEKKYRKKSEKR